MEPGRAAGGLPGGRAGASGSTLGTPHLTEPSVSGLTTSGTALAVEDPLTET